MADELKLVEEQLVQLKVYEKENGALKIAVESQIAQLTS